MQLEEDFSMCERTKMKVLERELAVVNNYRVKVLISHCNVLIISK
jgi:hypothetical protein